jgi:hypothetical protein
LKLDNTHTQEPHNEDQHRSARRENFSNMSKRITIKYNRYTKDYDYGIDGEYCGTASSYAEAERLANECLTEIITFESRKVAA